MTTRNLLQQRLVLQKRAEVAKHADNIRKLRVKMVTAREQLKQMRKEK